MEEKDINFITFSDFISSGFFGSTSIMAFYLGVAMLLGTYFRRATLYTSCDVFIYDIPDPSILLILLDSILLARSQGNLKKYLIFSLTINIEKKSIISCWWKSWDLQSSSKSSQEAVSRKDLKRLRKREKNRKKNQRAKIDSFNLKQ